MSCNDCTIYSIEKSLSLDTELYEDSHDYANIMRCETCSRTFLEYWVEIFDDGWKYWVEIDEAERTAVLAMTGAEYPKSEFVKFIETKPQVLCKNPFDKFTVEQGADCLLDGPPW